MAVNGKVPLAGLVEVQSGIYLEPGTAAAWDQMVRAARADRISLRVARPYGGYRDLVAQNIIYRAGSASGISVAAPGSSTHGFGLRVDVADFRGELANWLKANAGRFGFVFEFGSKDPNHLAFTGTPAIPPAPIRGDDMKYIYKEEGGVAWALLDSHLTAGYVQTVVVGEAENYRRVCPTAPVLVSAAEFSASIAAAVWHKSLCPAGGSGSFTSADRARLQAIPTAAENAKATVAEIAS